MKLCNKNLEYYGKKIGKLGKGASSVVHNYKGETGYKAIKKISVDFIIEVIREITALVNLNHSNIVKIFDVFSTNNHIYIVMEKMERDLYTIINNSVMKRELIDSCSYQLLRSVAFCHANGIIHRDIKPKNILVNKNGILKLADFGIARIGLAKYENVETMKSGIYDPMLTPGMVTLPYRAPEILMGKITDPHKYGYSVDNWSCGCVLAEMFERKPIFKVPYVFGKSKYDTLCRIFTILGKPDNKTWPGVEELPNFPREMHKYPSCLKSKKYNISSIQGLLNLNPKKRMTAQEAMNLPIYEDFKDFIEYKFPEDIKSCLIDKQIKVEKSTCAKTRQQLVNDLIEIGNNLKLEMKTIYLSIHIFDKYIYLNPKTSKAKYKLLGMCAMNLSSNLYEYITNIDYFSLVKKEYEKYTKERFLNKQIKMWKTLGCNLAFITPYDYILKYVRSNEKCLKSLDMYSNTWNKIISSVEYCTLNETIFNVDNDTLAKAIIFATHTKHDIEKELLDVEASEFFEFSQFSKLKKHIQNMVIFLF